MSEDGTGIRLLQTLAGADRGGAELHFIRLAEALARAGAQQQVVMRNHPKAVARLKAAGIPVTLARFGGALDFSTGRLIRTVAGAFRPQIALSYMSRATKLTPRGGYLLVARLGGYYDLKYYRHCDHLVGITPDLVDYFVREGWPRERATVIPNFVEDRGVPALPRAVLGTPEGVPLLVAVGRLHENKAFDTLLRATAAIPQAYLWLIGEGPERAKLEALARELGIAGRVRMPGWQDDVLPAIRAADVYLVPSRHEPLGSVVLEGWMARRPMVAAASQGPAWLIQEGETGLLVPIDAPQAMAAAVRRILGDPQLAERLAQQGRAAFEKDFTEAAAVRHYLALFRRLIDQAREHRR
jgi:glycosyltransferase involved in cell wall biosynthesis